jgi:hypothetical protein
LQHRAPRGAGPVRGLTIRPSRRRFAARLNSGVRPRTAVPGGGRYLCEAGCVALYVLGLRVTAPCRVSASVVHVAPARSAASLAASSASKPRTRGIHLRSCAGRSIPIPSRRTIAAGSWASLAQLPNSGRGLTIRPSRRRFAARLNSGVRPRTAAPGGVQFIGKAGPVVRWATRLSDAAPCEVLASVVPAAPGRSAASLPSASASTPRGRGVHLRP